jgi:hypothetical protein
MPRNNRSAHPVQLSMSPAEPVKDVELVEEEVAHWVHRYGADAPRLLREAAENAERHGDRQGAETWRELAAEAERLASGN